MTTEINWSSMKKRFKNLALVFVSTIVALLLGEVIIRIFLPQNLIYHNDAVWRPDSKFGWRHHENVNERVNFGEGEVGFRTDENGYRINVDGQINSGGSGHNILVLGDSYLEAVQVENRNTVPQILQKSLNQLPGIKTRFYNSGVGGWGPNHYLMEGKRVLEEDRLRIDQVLVFLYVGNDMEKRERDSFHEVNRTKNLSLRMPRSFDRMELSTAIIFPIGDYLKRNSHLFMLFKRRNRGLLTKLGMSSYYFPDIFQTKNQPMRNWETTTRICKKIKDAFKDHDIPVSFVLIPTTYQVNERIFEEYIEYFDIDKGLVDLEKPNKILKERFARDSMRLYDPLYFFRQRTKEGSILYGKVDTHFNKQGHAALAEFLLSDLAQQLKNADELPQN